MVKFVIPKNIKLFNAIQENQENISISVPKESIFELIEQKKLITPKYGKIFTGIQKINIKCSNSLSSILKQENYRLYVLVVFSKTRYRKIFEIPFYPKSLEIEISRRDTAGRGTLEFIITNSQKKRELKLQDVWKIALEEERVLSDYVPNWISFDKKYPKYDEAILDLYADENKPIIYLNKDVPGLYDLLFNMDLTGRKLTIQNIISEIIASYVLLGLSIYDTLTLIHDNGEIDIYGEIELGDGPLYRRLMTYFKDNHDILYEDNIKDALQDLIENKNPRTISLIILGIQQHNALRSTITELIGEN